MASTSATRKANAAQRGPVAPVGDPAMNWRVHPGAQRDALRGSLGTVGWVQQVLVNRRTGHVVDGHARVEEALSRGEPMVPVLYVDLDPEEEALVLATLDPISAMAHTDDAKLRELLDGITVDNAGLAALLKNLAGRKGRADPDAVPEPSEEPYVKPGELWLLGDHRLLCGDATNVDDVARLLGGAEPRLLVTDPPYGVSLDPTWRDHLYNGLGPAEQPYMRIEGHQNTTLSGDTIADWSAAYALVPSLEVGYVWHAGVHAAEVAAGLVRIGFEIVSQVIWDKGLFAMGRSWYHWRHEPCWVVRKPGVPNLFHGERNQSTVWRAPSPEMIAQLRELLADLTLDDDGLMALLDILWKSARDRTHLSTVWEAPSPKMIMGGSTEEKFDHPAQKPVAVIEPGIRNHHGDVYEPFAGSGTTIIAAEREGRRCYAMEIDPKYSQVSIERWQSFTGREAERIDG